MELLAAELVTTIDKKKIKFFLQYVCGYRWHCIIFKQLLRNSVIQSGRYDVSNDLSKRNLILKCKEIIKQSMGKMPSSHLNIHDIAN